jgi:signal transduction histidine kinase
VTDESGLDASHRLYASIIESLPLPLSVWCVEDPTDARSATLVAYNPTAERSAGVSLAHGIGKSAEELFPRAMDTELSELLTQVAASGKPAELPAFRFLSGERQWRTVSMLAFPLPGKCVGLASEDISLQDGARRLLAAERHVLELVASDARLDEVLANIVLAIEEHAPSTIASILLLDEQGTHVVHGAAPHLPDEYSRAVDGQPIGPANGSCGTAAFLRRAVFVSDIETDPLWSAYRHLALRFGLRACSSTPIMTSDERVLGTFALYYRERRTPSREDLELIARATHLAGIAIERRQLDDRTRALSAHLEAAREDERTAVAREIHDDLGQALTALKMDVAWIERRNRQASSLDRESLSQKLRAMSQMTDEIIDRVRRIAAGLRPGVLDDLGLSAAIEWQASEFQQRANTTCVVRSEIEQARFEHKVSTAIFRIFQEALTNVARHAQASRVDVLLSRAQGVLRLQVHDNGRGIGPAKLAHAGSLGLLGMHERARRLGGTFVIRVPPEGGTLLVVEIPLAPEREAAL